MRAIFRGHVLIACGVAGSVALSAALVAAGTRPGHDAVAPVPAGAADSAPGDASVVRLTGMVVPASQAVVRARVDGFVSRQLKRTGDRVAAGEAVSLIDDADLLLERDRCAARAEAAAHRCTAARAELRLLERRGQQLRATIARNSATAFELTQNQAEVEAAKARVEALEGERREADAACRALERRIGRCQCVAGIDGQVGAILRQAGDYARAGDAVAVVQSLRRQVRVVLPASLAARPETLSFTLTGAGQDRPLSLAESPGGQPQAGQSVALELPAGVELELGRTAGVKGVAR